MLWNRAESSWEKKVSIILSHQGITDKTTSGFHCIPVRMAKIQKMKENKCWQRCREKGSLTHHWSQYKLVQTNCA